MPTLPIQVARAAAGVLGRVAISADVPVEARRRRVELTGRIMPPPSGTGATEAELGGVPGLWLRPRGADGGAALLYLHGGAYILGSPNSHRALVARLAGAAGVTAFVPDYRMAPEHPHPAALEDALAAYRALLERGIPAERIAVAGDSAGGGLTLALAMAIRDRQLPAPAVLGLICPWTDLTIDLAGSRPPAPREPLLSTKALTEAARDYTAGGDPADPLISPLLGDLSGLPPIVLQYAGDDLLRDDGERLAALASAAGTEIDAHRYDGLWHVFHLLAPVLFGPAEAALDELGNRLRARLAPPRRGPRVAIVGAGMSGLCVGAKLLEAGIENFTIHEKADEVGGTWRENRYPGLSCDVPARFYSYSFAPNGGWSSVFAPGPEIQRYFTQSAERLGLRPRILFGSEIERARWEDSRWRLRAKDGHEDAADVLITATGILHHPRMPQIDGLDQFAGTTVHSARWPEELTPESLRDKRVALIGTGSTGIQLATALGGTTRSLLVFQRTAQWILPVPNRPYSPLTRTAFERFPALNRLAYRAYQRQFEALLGVAVVKDGWQRRLISAGCRLNLRFGVRDRELRRRLTPDYQPMCKRLVMSGGFYRAVQRPGVELVTDPIERIVPEGIATHDGTVHEVDVIVLATGFDAHAYMRPMEIVGEHGLTLEQAWAEGPRAYRTVSMPGFPNLFMLMGPHSPVGNQSLVLIAESQADYAIRWIELLRSGAVQSAAPTQAATDEFNAQMRKSMPDTVWATGCKSWYLGPDGLPELFPWTPREHRAMLAEPELEDYELNRTTSVS